jgi:putative glutamine amidotransferase
VKPRIAIPEPCSYDPQYSLRAFPAYASAVKACGGEVVQISLQSSPEEIARQVSGCAAVLLPGSKADIDPQKYGAQKRPETAPADALRDAADELLLQDAYSQRKPILGICYGLQAVNVWRSGTLLQHVQSMVNHSPGREVEFAHQACIEPGSWLREMLGANSGSIPVNSSHHQAAEKVGDGLRVAARCPEDGVIEALESTEPQHYVLAVQWHPERSFAQDVPSRRIFQSLIEAAAAWERKHAPSHKIS